MKSDYSIFAEKLQNKRCFYSKINTIDYGVCENVQDERVMYPDIRLK